MPVPRWLPQAHTEPPPPAALVDNYRVILSSQGFIALADTMADILRLPGIPDTLEIQVLDNAAIVSVTDEQRRDAQEITIAAGTSTDTLPRDRLIRARNAVALSVARIQILARWL